MSREGLSAPALAAIKFQRHDYTITGTWGGYVMLLPDDNKQQTEADEAFLSRWDWQKTRTTWEASKSVEYTLAACPQLNCTWSSVASHGSSAKALWQMYLGSVEAEPFVTSTSFNKAKIYLISEYAVNLAHADRSLLNSSQKKSARL